MNTVALELKGIYINNKYFQLYGLLGLGARWLTLTTETPSGLGYHSVVGNIQITPVGLRVGNALGAFAEFGFGYKGLMNTGVTYRFQKHSAKHSETTAPPLTN